MSAEERMLISERAMGLLERTATVLRNLSVYIQHRYEWVRSPDGHPLDCDHDFLGRIHFFSVLLHQALVCASSKVLGLTFRAGNPLSLRGNMPWLLHKMEYDSWCPCTRWRLNVMNDVENMVWVSGEPRFGVSAIHGLLLCFEGWMSG